MKIYTKTGDKGTTALIGGQRVYKFNKQVDTYGTIDELISYIGLLRSSYLNGSGVGRWKESKNIIIYPNEVLLKIQNDLMICASLIAKQVDVEFDLPQLKIQDDLKFLEDEIDKMDLVLPRLMSFIIPGGTVSSSNCHIARTVCRRAERQVVEISMSNSYGQTILINEDVIKYLNRLSDYLFTLARFLDTDEILWIQKKG